MIVVVLQTRPPGYAEILVLVVESLNLKARILFLLILSLLLVHLHVIGEKHVNLWTFKVGKQSLLLLLDKVRRGLYQVDLDVFEVSCELTHRLTKLEALLLTLKMSLIMSPEPGPISTKLRVFKFPKGGSSAASYISSGV